MRKIGIILAVLIILSFSVFNVLAADDSFTDFSDSSFSDSFGNDNQVLKFSGDLKYELRYILDNNEIDDQANTTPSLNLDLNYEKANSEFKGTVNFSEVKDLELREGYIKLYYDNFDLIVGKKKIVWGKGDKLHVVDNLNAEDLTDFVNQDYLDRKIAENMVKLNYYSGTGTLEAVYEPEFTTNKYAESGVWETNEVKSLNTLNTAIKSAGYSEIEEPTYHEFNDGQFALRYTNSRNGYDYGFSFYQGRLREPSINMEAVKEIKYGLRIGDNNLIEDGLDKLNLHYDRVTIFGTEFSSVIAGINSRAELAYYLTEDQDGTDPEVHNNRLAWIIGGDKDLPIHNLNVNVQLKSQLVLDKNKIKDNVRNGVSDLEYKADNDYLTNMIVVKVSDKFRNERVLPQISVVYNVEDHDYMWDNQLELKIKDNTSLKFNYRIFSGDSDTTFGQFDDNDYLSTTLEYKF